jgi:hypothetical protein
MWYPDHGELVREKVVTSIYTPQPPKPVASAAKPAAPKAAVPALPATRTSYQGAPQ